MPAELPGYYFDAEKNRYFKIQPNHVAPSGSKYSRQAVRTEKIIRKAQQQDELQHQLKLTQTVTRSRLLQHPLLVFDRRLGNMRKTAGALVSEYYAAQLTDTIAFSDFPPRSKLRGDYLNENMLISGCFSIEEASGTLFTDCILSTGIRAASRTHMYGFHLGSQLDVAEQELVDSSKWPIPRNYEQSALYTPRNAEDIGDAIRTQHILSMGSGLVLWSEYCTAYASPAEAMVKVGACGSGPFADRHSMIHQASLVRTVRNLAAQPGRYTAAVATERGVYLMDLSHTSYPLIEYPMGTNELLRATFKDHNVIMGGARSGKLLLCDIRAPPPSTKGGRTTATRLQHSDAVTNLAALPDGNRILISGQRSVKIYDLRFAPPPTLKSHLPRANTYKASPAVLTFNVPETHQHSWYGVSFAYDPELNIVLRTSTDGYKNNCVALWSASTGRMLPGPLNNHRFESSVACVAIARVRDGPKSIFVSCDGVITEWTPQGTGVEDGQD
ncbi:hypothetical protein Z517_06302 [Fonsecaea pedrosoi CBS 271.37]|uniref:Myocyte-specific enhancer factor 2d n=1 Tax=Fonsecaea pedrosoi CBS 271.37 TaxID=1442368 RepID=A0A0D2GFV0_9EURO|nr:uncharacterized protein Z517_06302 [Fonsecaea pedrosoi CBS 271.37]KIW79688.1 hypothetical protein Z517_06302 [Fonsecaea pedrosoi CBS 271.37]